MNAGGPDIGAGRGVSGPQPNCAYARRRDHPEPIGRRGEMEEGRRGKRGGGLRIGLISVGSIGLGGAGALGWGLHDLACRR
jgi:hypothetical protein